MLLENITEWLASNGLSTCNQLTGLTKWQAHCKLLKTRSFEKLLVTLSEQIKTPGSSLPLVQYSIGHCPKHFQPRFFYFFYEYQFQNVSGTDVLPVRFTNTRVFLQYCSPNVQHVFPPWRKAWKMTVVWEKLPYT